MIKKSDKAAIRKVIENEYYQNSQGLWVGRAASELDYDDNARKYTSGAAYGYGFVYHSNESVKVMSGMTYKLAGEIAAALNEAYSAGRAQGIIESMTTRKQRNGFKNQG